MPVHRLVKFLADNPGQARAWASVEGITTAQIADFVNDLTPSRLRYETRVTNHGFEGGRATPSQDVLQAGTAVLVDDHGLPRARCACGNPLLAPETVTANPSYTGTRWTGFSPGNIQVVVVRQSVTNFTLVDVDTGDPSTRPVGSDGPDDQQPGGRHVPGPGQVPVRRSVRRDVHTRPSRGQHHERRGCHQRD